MKTRFLTILCFVLLLAGCEDMLNVDPQGAPSSASFWTTEEAAQAGVNAIYSEYSNDDMYGRGFFWLNNASDDIGTKPRANAERIKNFTVNGAESDTRGIWALHYKVMKLCNDALRMIPSIDMDETLRQRLMGEAYFNHAVMHLELAYRYGDSRAGIPIQDRENPENVYVPRATNVQANYDYIAADLKKAAALLPYFDKYDGPDYGRAHKTAAWAYLVRTYLYAKNWEQAEKYADSVINSGKHQLLANYEDVFKIKNNWSKEYIWSVTSSAANTEFGSIFPGVVLEDRGWGVYNGWGNFYPTDELYKAFQAGDKRREATILAPGDAFMFFGEARVFGVGNSIPGPSNRTGYQFNKYMEPFSYPKLAGSIDTRYVNANGDKPSTALNLPLLRYADVLLMKAEARLMQGKNADAELNEIRARAFEPDMPLAGATMDDLKRERRCELAGEWTDRHWDLVRWGDAQAVYSQPLHHYDGSVIYQGRVFNPAVNHVWPIPPDEILVSKGAIAQNQGW